MLLLALTGGGLYAQENSRGFAEEEITPFAPSAEKTKKMSRRQYKKTYHYQFFKHHDDLVDQFYERIEDNKKKYRKLERKLKKPQYSDPSYFGHKRKPKRRPVGKMKFCKECGIRH